MTISRAPQVAVAGVMDGFLADRGIIDEPLPKRARKAGRRPRVSKEPNEKIS